MQKYNRERENARDRRAGFLFAAVALVLLIVTIVLTARCVSYRKQNENLNADYGEITDQLVSVRRQMEDLEQQLDQAKRELAQTESQIAALGGE